MTDDRSKEEEDEFKKGSETMLNHQHKCGVQHRKRNMNIQSFLVNRAITFKDF